MSAKIRKHQTTLIYSGLAAIAFELWSILRGLLLISIRMATFLYCIGLIHSAVFTFINAFRKTAIVYIG